MRRAFELYRILLVIAALLFLALEAAQADNARDEVANLVRSLGYGAGIHHFKNRLSLVSTVVLARRCSFVFR